MKHDIIKTENYLLKVSDEIPTTWYYDTYLNKLKHTGGAEYGESSISKKVIAHLPLNNSPILEGVDLLPPLEDEVEKLIMERVIQTMGNHNMNSSTAKDMIKIGVDCYNKAKEKYKYTDEDLIGVFNFLSFSKKSYSEFKDFIQSLQQPKYPFGFECEIETFIIERSSPENIIGKRHKTTINSQGQTVLVGKYIYE